RCFDVIVPVRSSTAVRVRRSKAMPIRTGPSRSPAAMRGRRTPPSVGGGVLSASLSPKASGGIVETGADTEGPEYSGAGSEPPTSLRAQAPVTPSPVIPTGSCVLSRLSGSAERSPARRECVARSPPCRWERRVGSFRLPLVHLVLRDAGHLLHGVGQLRGAV